MTNPLTVDIHLKLNELGLRCNGTRRLTLKTLHGEFEFRLRKYQFEDGTPVSFLDLSQSLRVRFISRGLQELSVYYSNRMSYREVSHLIDCYSTLLYGY